MLHRTDIVNFLDKIYNSIIPRANTMRVFNAAGNSTADLSRARKCTVFIGDAGTGADITITDNKGTVFTAVLLSGTTFTIGNGRDYLGGTILVSSSDAKSFAIVEY